MLLLHDLVNRNVRNLTSNRDFLGKYRNRVTAIDLK